MPKTYRMFIASSVSGAVREQLERIHHQREQIAAKLPHRVRWADPAQWHLTWLFLGTVSEEQLEGIQARLTEALKSVIPTSMMLHDIVFWPSGKRPKMIVGRLSPSPRLSQIADVIRAALPDFPADKPFTPHITLARLKDGPPQAGQQKPGWVFSPFAAVSCPIEDVTLYTSTLTPAGPIYQPMHIVPLAGLESARH
jgi:RNA 2',3'-cyclic 3'-phosphodiesterase